MEKVWVVKRVDEYEGSVNTEIKLFRNKEDAIKQKEIWKEEDSQFIDDIKADIDANEYCDSIIEDDELSLYACDSFSFYSLTIDVREMEVL